MRTNISKKSKKMNILLFMLIGIFTIGIVWAATAGNLYIGGQASLDAGTQIIFTSVSGGTATQSSETGNYAGDTLTFSVNLSGVGDSKNVTFSLQNTGNINVDIGSLALVVSSDSAGASPVSYVTATCMDTEDTPAPYSGGNTINAGSTAGPYVITVTWVNTPGATGTAYVTATVTWAQAT